MREHCINSWSDFKDRAFTKKSLNPQFVERPACFDVFVTEGPVIWSTTLMKGGADCADFETNYKHLCNYAAATVSSPFAADDFSAADDFVEPVLVTGNTAELDLLLTADNLYTDGGQLVAINLKIGDWIEVQVVHPTYGVVKSWGRRLLDPNHPNFILKPYAGHPSAGLKLRTVFHKAARGEGELDPTVGVNYNLHAQEI